MKKTILLTLLITICTSVFAQIKDLNKENIEYSFYMNNGHVIRGKLIDFKAKEYAKVETDDHKIVEVKLAEVSKVTKQEIVKDNHKYGSNYVGYFDAGLAITHNGFSNNAFRINFINGVRINQYITAGIGLGLRYFSRSRDINYPAYLNVRANLGPAVGVNDKLIYIECGFGTAIKSGSSLYFNPNIGVNLDSNKRFSTKLFFGYELYKLPSTGLIYDPSIKMFVFGVGTSF